VESHPTHLEPLGGAGGFSGAEFWRLATTEGRLCLRRWPTEHPSHERLREIHSVVVRASRELVGLLPVPIRDSEGQTYVEHANCLWELTPWLEGEANFRHSRSPRKLRSAMQTLARFHAACSAGSWAERKPSTSIGQRQRLLQRFLGEGAAPLSRALSRCDWPDLANRGQRHVRLFADCAKYVADRLHEAAPKKVPHQPCIRDIWHDHVLFTGDTVTGIVDFGALRQDTVAGDIARLLGSLVGDDIEARRQGIDDYSQVRPLSAAEHSLIDAFDVSTTLLSGMNWLQWICVERRSFEPRQAVLERLDEIIARAELLVGRANPL
jgi:homoserine kinase type II